MTRFYSVAELAAKAGISGAYIRRLIISKRLKAEKVGGTWAIESNIAEDWLEARRVKSLGVRQDSFVK